MPAEATHKAAAGGEDSMEQILHSIRDIIAEKTDGVSPAAAPAEEDDDVLELTEVVNPIPQPQPETAFQPEPADIGVDVLSTIDAALGTVDEPAQPEPEPEPHFSPEPETFTVSEEQPTPEPEPMPDTKPAASGKNLVSDASAAQTMQALKELRNNIPRPQIESPEFRSGNTVEDLVVEAIKPMLSQWLDANLPLIVRELVQKEIEKLVPHETRD